MHVSLKKGKLIKNNNEFARNTLLAELKVPDTNGG